MRIKHFLLLASMVLMGNSLWADDYTVSSPNGKLKVVMHLVDGQLTYTVQREDKTLVQESPLGIVLSNTDLSQALTFVNQTLTEVNDTYTLPTGKKSTYNDHCNYLSVTVQNPDTWKLMMQFKVYDDGFAFRYVVPKSQGKTSAIVTGEKSRIRMADFKYCLGCRFVGNIQSPNYPYEGLYGKYFWSQMLAWGDTRMNAPALICNGSEYMLLSEAANLGNYSLALLKAETEPGTFSFSSAGNTKDYETDKDQKITCDLPIRTPWRMAITGSLATILESVMTENLNTPTTLTDTSWIKPGISAWYWGGSDGNDETIRNRFAGGLEEAETSYTDLAAEMGWPYALVDGGWSSKWIERLVKHANEQGVQVLLWQTAKLSDNTAFSNATMEATLQQWSNWGIKGIKIDFWEDDSKETMYRMEHLLQVAAKYHMLVNFHGCTRPSGLRRTYPNLMTQEGVYGGECNFWANKNVTADHHLNLMFTRNVVGSMDYTPGDFARYDGQLLTNVSQGQRLGLLTGFESGIVHVSEATANLQYFLGRDIMKRFPTTWDDTHVVEASITPKYLTFARRKGADWWVSSATVEARTSKLTLDFLDADKEYTAYIYQDGTQRTSLTFSKQKVTRETTLTIPELSNGGFLIQISTDADLPTPTTPDKYEAESSSNTKSTGVTINTGDELYTSGGKQINNLGVGRSLTFRRIQADTAGDYLLTIYYATEDQRYAKLMVNNTLAQDSVKFWGNSSYNMDGASWIHIPIHLKAGQNNTITIMAYTDSWAPNIDYITIQPLQQQSQDGVKSVTAQQNKKKEDSRIYALNGTQVAKTGSGIYIQGGKKYLIKQ